jgi:hypothetical protein
MVAAEVLPGVGQMRDCPGGWPRRSCACWGSHQERCAGFTVKHFHEQLQRRHRYNLRRYGDPAGVPGGGAGAADAAARGASQEAAEAASLMMGTMVHQSLPSGKAGDAWRFAWLPGDKLSRCLR